MAERYIARVYGIQSCLRSSRRGNKFSAGKAERLLHRLHRRRRRTQLSYCTAARSGSSAADCGGIDQDECALLAASERLAPFGDTVHLVRDNFSNLASVASEHGIGQADGILLDLGVSSYQLDTPERGFSYIHNAPLDMRMDDRSALTAAVIVNTYPEHEIADIISRFGEERFARKIAARICEIRTDAPIETTSQLADICRSVIPARLAATSGNPAKRTFQAIRIAVNAELDVITPALRAAAELLVPGGRLAVITFHSLEDRIVKNEFSELAAGCTCPPDFPVCVWA